MKFIANTLALKNEIEHFGYRSRFLFDYSTPWLFIADLWMSTPTDRLIITHSSNGSYKTTGRGRFERASDIKLLMFNDDPVNARFVTLIFDDKGLPILPGGFVGIDINHPNENASSESFEMRFIAANFEEKLYAFGFCSSDAGEPDTGIFIVTNSRKQALLCYDVANAAQRLHGRHQRLKEYLQLITSKGNN